eukprot:scaffold26385_cov82-Phaeocystis_antarctica.AAC.4
MLPPLCAARDASPPAAEQAAAPARAAEAEPEPGCTLEPPPPPQRLRSPPVGAATTRSRSDRAVLAVLPRGGLHRLRRRGERLPPARLRVVQVLAQRARLRPAALRGLRLRLERRVLRPQARNRRKMRLQLGARLPTPIHRVTGWVHTVAALVHAVTGALALASLTTTYPLLLTTSSALVLATLLTTYYLLRTYLSLSLCDAVRLGLEVNAPPVLELELLQRALQRRTHALVLAPVLTPLLAPVLPPVRLALVGLGLARSRDGPAARRALAFVRV